jgi:hypothetical protein
MRPEVSGRQPFLAGAAWPAMGRSAAERDSVTYLLRACDAVLAGTGSSTSPRAFSFDAQGRRNRGGGPVGL